MAAANPKTNPMVCTTAGTEFILAIALAGAGGYFLGRWLGWPVTGAFAGGLLGFGGGLYRLIRTALAWQKDYAEQIDADRQQPSQTRCED